MTSVIANGITNTPSGNFLLGTKKPRCNEGSILHWLKNQPEFSIFAGLVEKAVLCDQFDNCGETLTLFVPSNDSIKECGLAKVLDQNPRIFVSSHTLRNKVSRCDYNGELFQSKDLFGKDSIIDARKDICYYGKAPHSLTFSLDWMSKAEIGGLEVKCVNGYINPIANPIFYCDNAKYY